MDLQKASIMKRLAAWLLDAILTAIVSVGFAVLLSVILRYDNHSETYRTKLENHESQYGIMIQVSQEQYDAMSKAEQQSYNEIAGMSNLVFSLSLVMISGSILLGILSTEFVVPLLLKNGQTIGKKAFSIGLVKADGVKINAMQLFVRALLGKYTIETMIPVYILVMFYFNVMDITGTFVLGGLLLAQLICLAVSSTNSLIHDLLAGTVTVDIASQKIFGSTDELVAYTNRMHAEQAKKQDY